MHEKKQLIDDEFERKREREATHPLDHFYIQTKESLIYPFKIKLVLTKYKRMHVYQDLKRLVLMSVILSSREILLLIDPMS